MKVKDDVDTNTWYLLFLMNGPNVYEIEIVLAFAQSAALWEMEKLIYVFRLQRTGSAYSVGILLVL